MLQLISSGYNLLTGYPTGKNPKGQAELTLNFQKIEYAFSETGELIKTPKIKSVRFITESDQLKQMAIELMELAAQLDAISEKLESEKDVDMNPVSEITINSLDDKIKFEHLAKMFAKYTSAEIERICPL